MKALCDGLNLSVAVSNVTRAISNKGISQILEGIKVTAKSDYILLSATDNEISIVQKIPAEVLIEGEVVVPGKYFSDFIRKLDSRQIELAEVNNSGLKITYDESEGVLQTYAVNEFPDIDKISTADSFTISQKELKDLINKTVFCAAVDDSRPVFQGVLFEIYNEVLKAVSLDGYRLALITKKLESATKNISIIVPSRSLVEITKFLSDEETPVFVYFDSKKIMIEQEGVTFITRLKEGEFIKYENILPKGFVTKTVFNKESLEESLDRASVLVRGAKNSIASFDIKEDKVNITCVSEIGTIKEKVQVKNEGKDIKIAFNPKYINDALRVIKEDVIVLNTNSETTPAAITPASGDDYYFMILPIRVAT